MEESLVVAMKDLRKPLLAWEASNNLSISHCITGGADWPTVDLNYRWRDTEDVNIPVRLEATLTQFGGRRWWFVCPLIVRGIACNRRAGKLYLPPGAKYFGCRKCHDLTYKSCQEAHQTERLLGRLGFDAQVAKMWDRMHRKK